MSRAAYSVAMTGEVASEASTHLLRADRQEDVCFALWHPSRGRSRMTALVSKLILPLEGDRNVHGNASFEPAFFERAISEAAALGAGLALMHSHPRGRGWQGMSVDDVRAEQAHAGAVFGATGLPFVGLTVSGDQAWSARFWIRTAPRISSRHDCATVRVVGDRCGSHIWMNLHLYLWQTKSRSAQFQLGRRSAGRHGPSSDWARGCRQRGRSHRRCLGPHWL